MKFIIKNSILKGAIAAVLLFNLQSCEIDEVPNPNGPGVEEVIENASASDLSALAAGTEALMRFDLGFYYDAVGVVGREYWRFTAADPRYTADLLGAAPLDNNTFYTTRSYAGRYRAIRNALILLEATENSKAITEEQKNGYRGFAKTIQAYQLLLNLNMQFQNGIRTDVSDPDNLGPFTTYDEGLDFIADLLESAYQDLGSAGSSFAFRLSSGFAGFNTPTTFNQFNQALAARVAIYQENYSAAQDHLNKSFFNPAGDLNTGVYHYFSTAGGDQINQISFPPNTKDALVAHPSFVAALEPGDDRASKISQRTESYTLDNLTGTHDVVTYPSQSSFIPIIRNEELILIQAEIHIANGNLTDAAEMLNVIRNAHGLGDYAGPGTEEALTDELLLQRFLSLFQEGHRWIDMRRFGRLGDLPLDRAGDQVWEQFPRPLTEG